MHHWVWSNFIRRPVILASVASLAPLLDIVGAEGRLGGIIANLE
jgi:hypothetical protein